MATTSYSVLPYSTTVSQSNHSDPYQRRNQDFYGSNIETSTVHPYQTTYGSHIPERQRPIYSQNSDSPSKQTPINQSDPQHQSSTGFGQGKTLATNHQKSLPNNNPNDPQMIKRSTTQPATTKNKDTQPKSTKNQVSKTFDQHPRSNTPTSLVRSEQQISQNHRAAPEPAPTKTKTNIPTNNQKPVHRHPSPTPVQQQKQQQRSKADHQMSNDFSETTKKPAAQNQNQNQNQKENQRTNKSTIARAAAIKKLEAEREQKRTDKYFPSSQNKMNKKEKTFAMTPDTDNDDEDGRRTRTKKKISQSLSHDRHHLTDGERSDLEKRKTEIKHAYSVPKTLHHDDDRSEHDKTKPKQKKMNPSNKSHEKRTPASDGDLSDHDKSKKHHKHHSRHDDHPHPHPHPHHHHHHEDDSSDDNKHHRSKSRKRQANSDSHAYLPPIRRHRAAEGQPDHAHRGRHPYYDYYPPYELIPTHHELHRHLYEDANDVPPYLAPYHDAYDPFFDYDKRKKLIKNRRQKNDSRTDHDEHENGEEAERENRTRSEQSRKSHDENRKKKSKGRKSRADNEKRSKSRTNNEKRSKSRPGPSYYPDDDVLDLWRQERNDYLKSKFKPTVHDVLYAQQWMKADSYVENQRRRQLRESQGFYFPYKKYTINDYKEIQKLTLQNPYGEGDDQILDRRERARKRQEYGEQVERNTVENPGNRQIPPRDMQERPPWHVNRNETPPDSDRVSKRERALEYARDQVKYRLLKESQHISNNPDDSNRNRRSRATNNDYDQSYDETPRRYHQSYDDYEE